MGKNETIISWADLQAMGNPENAPTIPAKDDHNENHDRAKDQVRIYLERKHRGGKTVSVIKGLSLSEDELNTLGTELKKKCGVGGSIKNGEIIIQGDHRKRLVEILIKKGYSNCKNAGS